MIAIVCINMNVSAHIQYSLQYTVQLKGNVALARYTLARFSKTIHLILDTCQRSLAVYRVLITRISLMIYISINHSTTRSKTITREMTR